MYSVTLLLLLAGTLLAAEEPLNFLKGTQANEMTQHSDASYPVSQGVTTESDFRIRLHQSLLEMLQKNESVPTTTMPSPEVLDATLKKFDSTCQRQSRCIGCSTLQICATAANHTWKHVEHVMCSGDYPYCDSSIDACVSYTPTTCGVSVNEACYSDGVYPDINDCNKYIKCIEGEAFTYRCNTGMKFDIVSKECKTNAECASVSCENSHGRRIPLSNSDYFVFCSNKKVLMVGKCEPGEIFESTQQKCYMKPTTTSRPYYTTTTRPPTRRWNGYY